MLVKCKSLTVRTLILLILLFSYACTAVGAEDLYLGKRWGFSLLTKTPVHYIVWSADGKYMFFAIAGDDMSYIYRLKDVWKIIKGKTLPGDIRPERIIDVKGRIQDFSASPDRMSATYSISEGGEHAGLYVANLAACQTKRIADGKGARWSPDGTKILFYFMGKKGNLGIATIKPDGTGLRILSELGDWGPEWSPDGNNIAFLSSRGFSTGTTGYSNIYIRRLNPAGITQVTHDKNSLQKNLEWAPKGKKLVFESYNGVEIIDVTTMKRKRIISRSDYFTSHRFLPFFSPDGRWIFYRKEKGMGLYEIYTQEEINLEGSIIWESITLSPDGKKVAFSVFGGSKKGLWVVEAMPY